MCLCRIPRFVKEDTDIMDDLEVLYPAQNIQLFLYKYSLEHGDLIEQFMNRLTAGEHTITVFSKLIFSPDGVCMSAKNLAKI